MKPTARLDRAQSNWQQSMWKDEPAWARPGAYRGPPVALARRSLRYRLRGGSDGEEGGGSGARLSVVLRVVVTLPGHVMAGGGNAGFASR